MPISFPELRSPWPAVGKRELWEQPFQACAIAWNRCRLRLRSEPDNQNSVISYFNFKMDAPRVLVFRPLVKGNEALGTRLARCMTWRGNWRAQYECVQTISANVPYYACLCPCPQSIWTRISPTCPSNACVQLYWSRLYHTSRCVVQALTKRSTFPCVAIPVTFFFPSRSTLERQQSVRHILTVLIEENVFSH